MSSTPPLANIKDILHAKAHVAGARDRMTTWRDTAERINAKFRATLDKPPPLDEIPYGEEALIAEGLIHVLEDAEKLLSPEDGKVLEEVLADVNELLQDVENTMEELGSIPAE